MNNDCIQSPLWTCGDDVCHTYRIPALVVAPGGTVLAFCEGRRHSDHDTGQIDLLLRRSDDGGRSWEPTHVLVAEAAMTCGNPCPIVDHQRGRVSLLFCKNRAEARQGLIMAGQAERTVWITSSCDDGQTWTQPHEITSQVKQSRWTWYATGPGHGIQLRSGRLVAPANHCNPYHYRMKDDRYSSHVIFSDDGGETWQIGGMLHDHTNEGMLVELSDGALLFHRRYEGKDDFRCMVALSHDGGLSFGPSMPDPGLFDPTCQSSSLAVSMAGHGDRQLLLFANPASHVPGGRTQMTLRASLDDGQSWPVSRVLHFGPSAYSDLAQTPDGSILCLYEYGVDAGYQHLMLARLTVDWLVTSQVAQPSRISK